MRIGFITPTLHTLGPRWQRDPQIVKLAVPTISGYLYEHGYREIRQYDFEVEIFDLEAKEPGRLNLRVFFDDDDVNAYVQGEDKPEIEAQVELILHTLEVEEADVYALSTASVLEIYADMHSCGNINLCLIKKLKDLYPNCTTIVGGLQISPDSLQREEYLQMLRRCDKLDFVAEGKGEPALYALLKHLEGITPIEESGLIIEEEGNGQFLRTSPKRSYHVPKGLARRAAKNTPSRKVITPDEKPTGEQEREPLYNPSVQITPYFDPKNIQSRKMKGFEILKRYHLDDKWKEELKAHIHDEVAILPLIFLEGCNATCAFCAYSMTSMAKREISDVIQAMAWMRETYDVQYFHFLNTNINGFYKYAEVFADELTAAKLDVYWSDCANLWAADMHLFEKLALSGCIRLTYGVECPSDRMLKYIRKGINVEKAHERLKESHDVGIWNHMLLITGLPQETTEDTKAFVDFLERSKDYANGYSVSSFYLIETSLFGAFPEEFNINMHTNASGLLEDQGFDEVGGLTWTDKKKQIVESTQIITDAIQRIKVEPKYWSGAIDLELIFWLYHRLGRERKADIVRAYEEAFIGVPAHPKAYEAHIKQVIANPPDSIGKIINATDWRPQTGAMEIKHETVTLPFSAGSERIELDLRCLEYGAPPTLAAGKNLGISARGTPGFSASLDEIVAEGSPFCNAIEKVGWKVTERARSYDINGVGFRIENEEHKLDLMVTNLREGEPAAVRKNGLGFSYKAPKGSEDPTQDPAILRFVMRMGGFVLDQILKSADGQNRVPPPTEQELYELAGEMIQTLESHYASDIKREPDNEYLKKLGARHGPHFSKVAEAHS